MRLLLSSCTAYFYPRPPGGGRLVSHQRRAGDADDFYPRPPGGGRPNAVANGRASDGISIHALRVEGDLITYISYHMLEISIHALRVEGDRRTHKITELHTVFLSTPSGWRATIHRVYFLLYQLISIHALRVEGDVGVFGINAIAFAFLSTPSGWRATRPCTFSRSRNCYFYPRPPGGGRPILSILYRNRLHFYPRPPGGGRLVMLLTHLTCVRFLSTPSGWRATDHKADKYDAKGISIHALRVEGDCVWLYW